VWYHAETHSSEEHMRVWFISDTHGEHLSLHVPPNVDLVIHCGDESNSGDAFLNEPEARLFFEWYSELEIPTKVFVPGNHSTAIEHGLIRSSDYPKVKFLVHALEEWNGINIFGSPYTPEFFNWSYMKPRSELDAVWQSIPDGIDILITHGPPKGIRDVTKDFESREPVHVGSKSLRRHVESRIKPRIHAFGHIHDEKGIQNFGTTTSQGIQFINCSACDLSGRLRNHGVIFDLETNEIS
jgi:Icc-related predicted phosphoesterase